MSLGIYRKEWKVTASSCDYEGKLSLWDVFALFQDMAAEHAGILGIGLYDLAEKDMFWLTLRTKVRFFRKADMYEDVAAVTWPEVPDRARCLRDYALTSGDELLADGKTEWAIMNRKTGKLVKPAEIYPEEMEILNEFAFTDKLEKLDNRFEGETFAEYVIKSTDMDVGGHMNNIAYIRAFAGLLPVDEWKRMRVKEMEVAYKEQCFEGEILTFKKKEEEGRITVQAFNESGKAAFQVIVVFE